MKVKELVEKLSEYNQDAEISVIACNKRQEFSMCYGDIEGVTKEKCRTVDFYVDALNQSEVG